MNLSGGMKKDDTKPLMRAIHKSLDMPSPFQSSSVAYTAQTVLAKKSLPVFTLGPLKAPEENLWEPKPSYHNKKRSTVKRQEEVKASIISKTDCETTCDSLTKDLRPSAMPKIPPPPPIPREVKLNQVAECSQNNVAKPTRGEIVKTVRKVVYKKTAAVPTQVATTTSNKVGSRNKFYFYWRDMNRNNNIKKGTGKESKGKGKIYG